MKRGFTVIEILIAMVILFVAIAFVNISIKAFNNYQRKSEIYQNFYITALSLKDWLTTQSLEKKVYKGVQNNIKYKLKITTLLQKKNYTFSMSLGEGNYGDYLITLYKVEMILTQGNKEEKFNFFLTKQLSLKSNSVLNGDIE